MADVSVLINSDELKEKDEVLKFLKDLDREEELKLLGFLMGLSLKG